MVLSAAGLSFGVYLGHLLVLDYVAPAEVEPVLGPLPPTETDVEEDLVGILLFRRGAACPERIRAPVPTRR